MRAQRGQAGPVYLGLQVAVYSAVTVYVFHGVYELHKVEMGNVLIHANIRSYVVEYKSDIRSRNFPRN